jgi:threonine dehydrogenase-like Zn-dependent dehydrogenase
VPSPSKVLSVSAGWAFIPLVTVLGTLGCYIHYIDAATCARDAASHANTAVLAVGLSHVQTKVMPMVGVTNKELEVRGITRYTASCFPSAIDLLARGVVDLKQLITNKYPLGKSHAALEAVAAGKDIKIIIKNQE